MIESRNSMGMLDPAFLYTRDASRVSTFRLGMQRYQKNLFIPLS